MSQEIQYCQDAFSEYLNRFDCISASDVKNFLRSPAYYRFKKYEYQKEDYEESRALYIGTALHARILEPKEFENDYVVAKKFDQRTTLGKQGFKEFQEQNADKKILNYEELEMINRIAESALANKTFVELIKDSYKELSIYSVDETTGLKIRLRPDNYSRTKSVITDVKSTIDASPKGFKKDVYYYGYGITAAFYLEYSKKDSYVFLACEKQEPYPVALYTLSDDILSYGRQQIRMALDLLKFCYDNNYWPGYDEWEAMKRYYDSSNLENFFEHMKYYNLINEIK